LDVKSKLEKRGTAGEKPSNDEEAKGAPKINSNAINETESTLMPSVRISDSQTKDTAELEMVRIVAPERDALSEGLLAKYFAPNFTDQMDMMDKIQRKNSVNYLLHVFKKLDNLLLSDSFFSLDLDINTRVQRLIDDTQELLQCNFVTVYRIDGETGELFDFQSEAENIDKFSSVNWV
jgi:hypothetical protein